LVVNPHSRAADDTDLDQGIAGVESSGVRLQRFHSTGPEQTRREISARAATLDLVVLAGGDGTLHAALETLRRHELALGVLPLGTANDLARSLGIPAALDEAFAILRGGHRKRIDLGRVNGRPFLNAVNIGLGVTLNKVLTEESKQRLGVLSYLRALFASLSRSRSFRARVEVDGKEYSLRSMQMAIGNGRFYGGGNVINDSARIDDGLLHLYSIEPQRLWQLLLLAPLWRSGKHRLAQSTFCISGRHIVVRTSRSLEVYADGEQVTCTPAEIEVMPAELEVVAPNVATPGETPQEECRP
jgi:YegS/Rv2252/BmrU family lipid kinase